MVFLCLVCHHTTQASHNERVAKEARADWINGHILALPFSDKYAGVRCPTVTILVRCVGLMSSFAMMTLTLIISF